MSLDEPGLIGVDGCPGGWVAVHSTLDFRLWRVLVSASIRDIPGATVRPLMMAIDMPIGLPDKIAGTGRGPEQAVRALLGQRQSSVFSIPARAAVESTDYASACRCALSTSDPPRKVAKQAFNLFPRIRELDQWLRNEPGLQPIVHETHPELAFRLIKGEPLAHPKKSMEGRQERLSLLARAGLPDALLAETPPPGAKPDDLLDAIACMFVARRIYRSEAQRFPAKKQHDAHGLPIAIWG